MHATINSSYILNFCEVLTLTKNMRLLNDTSSSNKEDMNMFYEWLLKISDSSIGDCDDMDNTFDIPHDLII